MNFEKKVAVLTKKLSAKHPVQEKKEIQLNDNERRLELLKKIQSVVIETMEDISQGRFPCFLTTSCSGPENWFFDGRVIVKRRKIKFIDFKRQNSRSDFTTVVFLLSKIYRLLTLEQTSTRRELYYRNLEVFKSQKQVDYGMRVASQILSAAPWELRVLATSKGIVAGPAVLTLANGELVDCSKEGGVSIPQDVLDITTISTSATWVLIVEKDASFQRLATNETTTRLGPCILLTGKGFPDVNSRILVCKFWELLRIPILALVDADPHGFEIMCVYRFGSLTMSSCTGPVPLACPAIRWIGVHPADIRPLLLDSKTLSLNDLRRVRALLKRPYVQANDNLREQLEVLLEGNVKAEIEGVTSISTNYLTDIYIRNKIQCEEYF